MYKNKTVNCYYFKFLFPSSQLSFFFPSLSLWTFTEVCSVCGSAPAARSLLTKGASWRLGECIAPHGRHMMTGTWWKHHSWHSWVEIRTWLCGLRVCMYEFSVYNYRCETSPFRVQMDQLIGWLYSWLMVRNVCCVHAVNSQVSVSSISSTKLMFLF